ncbi:MAG: hypothetical protein LBN22_04080 [Clostridiales Family XIII bacterium]|nr:hypothetical protein [Clostridiales Family XIII bacterium]
MGQFDYPYVKETSLKLVKIPEDAPNHDRNEWSRIEHETLVIASKLDPIHPYEYGVLLVSYIPRTTLKEVTSKTVSGQLHAQESYEAIRAFLIS